MYASFPADHPFAHCTGYASTTYPTSSASASSASTTASHPKPSVIGPVPPRRTRVRPTHFRTNSSRSAGSYCSVSTTVTASSVLLTPATFRCTSPDVAVSRSECECEDEDEHAFFARLSTNAKHFGMSSRHSSRSSQEAETPHFEAFVAGLPNRCQFGSINRRGGMELEERHERIAEGLLHELSDVRVETAVRVVL